MNPDFRLTLDIGQLVLLGGVIWGLARMSNTVETLTGVSRNLVKELKEVSDSLANLTGRVLVLEDRTKR